MRATEEKTAIGFIKRRQEDEMRMNGKFDRNSLCVVLSKTEDLDSNAYLKEEWIAKHHPNIKRHLDRAQMLDKIVRKADSGPKESEPGTIGHNIIPFVSKDGEVEANRREFLALTESLKQAAVAIRNQSVSDRIQQDFRQRRKEIKSPKNDKLLDDNVEVIPTSARAFQAIRHPGGVKEAGFPDESATIFIDAIVEDWEHTFQIVVPGYEIKIQKSLEHVWQRYLTALNEFCEEHNALRPRSNGKVQQAIEDAEEDLVHDAHRVLKDLRDGAQEVHPLFREEIQKILEPIFQKAYAIKGQGCVRKRDKVLQQFAAKHSANMPVKACEAMEAALAELIQDHANALEELAANTVSEVETRMKNLLGIKKASSSAAARMNQKDLVADFSPHVTSWKLCWQKPSGQREDHVMRGDLSIPDPELLKIKDDEDGV
ncbi:hypothetical protein SLS64_003486 [Diaporthe eres]